MKTKPNIIIICLDLGRPDYLGCYLSDRLVPSSAERSAEAGGFIRNTSPNIDRVAQNGVVFESVTATAPWTIPSHASMFTGLYPHQHQANWHTFRIKPGIKTIFDLLTEQGYQSVAVTANTLLVSPYNMFGDRTKILNSVCRKHPEVSVFVDEFDERKTNAPAVANTFLGFLESFENDRPLLAYLNFYDLHSKYSAPEPFFSEFVSPAGRQQLKNIGDLYNLHFKEMNHQVTITPDLITVLRDFYCAKLKMIDHYLGEIFNTLQEKKLWDNTLLVITSDHGDILGDHQRPSFHHQFSIYNAVLNIPLICHYPDFITKPKHINAPLIQNIDIFPTILEICGLPTDHLLPGAPGKSLVNYFHQNITASPRPFAIAQTNSPEIFLKRIGKQVESSYVKNLYAIQNEKYKLIFSDSPLAPAGSELSRPDFLELYNLESDKTEQHNIAEQHPDLVKLLKNMFFNLTQSETESPDAPADSINFNEQATAQLKKRLKILGYLE